MPGRSPPSRRAVPPVAAAHGVTLAQHVDQTLAGNEYCNIGCHYVEARHMGQHVGRCRACENTQRRDRDARKAAGDGT